MVDGVNIYDQLASMGPLPLLRPKHLSEHPHRNVSCQNRCQTNEAQRLCIYNVNIKEDRSERQDIGGTYEQNTPEFWFFYTTTMRPNSFLLLNLFVCYRKSGRFSIRFPKADNFTIFGNIYTLSDTLTSLYFRSTQNDETHYIKTFHFPLVKLRDIDNDLPINVIIPISIQIEPLFTLNENVLNCIKLQHSQSNDIPKRAKPDFIIKSESGKEYPTHKILLAAHSPVLRQLIKDKKSLHINSGDSTIELVLQFIYNQKLNEISNHNVPELLEIVHKFQLKSLLILVNGLIDEEISINNAVEMALIAKKYKLDAIQHKIYTYINNNPAVMNSEAWKQMDDAELAKDMFQFSVTQKVA